MTTALMEVEGLVVERARSDGTAVRTVDNVDLCVPFGASVGLVGESGSGKTTTVRAMLGLVRPASGRVTFDGRDILNPSRHVRRELSRQIQLVYQDPQSSLDPRMTVEGLVGEPLIIHHLHTGRAARRDRVVELLEQVGLGTELMTKRPGTMSGGQLQRVAIARALAVEPALLLCDEIVSALDVSVQAQILNVLKELQQRLDLTLLFISHDLGVIRYICDTMAVMYQGRIVECGPTESVIVDPVDPYTKRLIEACPDVEDVRLGGEKYRT